MCLLIIIVGRLAASRRFCRLLHPARVAHSLFCPSEGIVTYSVLIYMMKGSTIFGVFRGSTRACYTYTHVLHAVRGR